MREKFWTMPTFYWNCAHLALLVVLGHCSIDFVATYFEILFYMYLIVRPITAWTGMALAVGTCVPGAYPIPRFLCLWLCMYISCIHVDPNLCSAGPIEGFQFFQIIGFFLKVPSPLLRGKDRKRHTISIGLQRVHPHDTVMHVLPAGDITQNSVVIKWVTDIIFLKQN